MAVAPDGIGAFGSYWRAQRLPFIGLPDPDHVVARRFRQEVNLFKFGRMPLVCVVDGEGNVRFAHRGASMDDIPENRILFEVSERIRANSL
jgi:hypothetical protein